MKTKRFHFISCMFCMMLFALSLNSFGQKLNLYITDNGPTPITGYYTFTFTVVEVDQNGNIVGSFSVTPSGYYWDSASGQFLTGWPFTCGVPKDVTEKIYRVDVNVWRDSTTPPVSPFLASGSGSSALLNSDDFYNPSGINVTVEIR